MSNVFAGLIVLVTLLFLTPLLYHLPQAVLAAVIMMAVIGLINFKAIAHAWHTHKHDGIASVVTFVATLAFAPHLDNGIMVGAGLGDHPLSVPHHETAGRHSRPPSGRHAARRQGAQSAGERKHHRHALRRLAVFCQRALFRRHHSGSSVQQPAAPSTC